MLHKPYATLPMSVFAMKIRLAVHNLKFDDNTVFIIAHCGSGTCITESAMVSFVLLAQILH